MKTFTPTPPRYRIIGHRGLAARAPENTLAGFKLAATEGIDWVEFDVQLSKDNALILLHDDTLSRTTNGKGFVFDHTLEDLSTLDAGSWFSPAFKGEPIPELTNTLSTLFELKLHANIELKVPETPPVGYLARFASVFSETLQSCWPSDSIFPLVSSFNWALLEAVRERIPSLPIGYLSETCSVNIINDIAAINNAALHCDHSALHANLLLHAKKKGLPILAYTVNDAKQVRALLNQGVFAVFSDDPTSLT